MTIPSDTTSIRRSAVAVDIHDMSFRYDKTEEVLTDVNLRVFPGDFLAVIGPNGGGKTTLLKLILGLLHPTDGSVRVFGAKPENARSRIGYVPQFSTLNNAFPACALDVVLMGGAHRSLLYGTKWSRSAQSREKAIKLLSDVGLSGFEKTDMTDLSGGQRQRVLVARALMGRPEDVNEPYLLILDEPTANIDPQGKFCFYEFLHDIHQQLCIIVVSHDLMAVTDLFTAVALVNRHVNVTNDKTLAPEMLNMFFGYHGQNCPVNTMLRSITDHMDEAKNSSNAEKQ